MARWFFVLQGIAAATLLTAGCAAPTPGTAPTGDAGSAAAVHTAAPKRILAAVRASPISLAQRRTQPTSGSVPGLDAIEELMSAGLVHMNDQGQVLAQLAEAVPSLDNGLWKLLPDGRMETTVHIRSDARWHDGAPVTSDDVLFTTTVEQDKEAGAPKNLTYDLVESITAPDPRTVVVTWKQPYTEADSMFSYEVAPPMPRHLLADAYNADKASFYSVPYWNTEFVGAGPYQLREWVTDSHIIMTANDSYVLGRPKIDEIEVRFIADPNTLMANVLAGVELTLGRALSIDQSVRIVDQWQDGEFHTRPYGWIAVSPQFINPNPAVVLDLRFRRAMLQAIDRTQLLDSLMAGRGSVANAFVSPDVPEYKSIESSIVRYDYDPRQAAQTLAELGYTKGPDGLLYDGSQQKLEVTTYYTVQNDVHPKATAAVADFWKQVGVSTIQNAVSIQQATDREYRAQFPTFDINEIAMDLSARNVRRFHSEQTPLPENRFTQAGNASRYRSAELDSYIEGFLTTIPREPRLESLAKMVHHQTENLTVMGLLNTVRPTVVSKRLQNVTAVSSRATEPWNVQDWDVTR
jgi:peptide/nickel transport system substrate-binding protein